MTSNNDDPLINAAVSTLVTDSPLFLSPNAIERHGTLVAKELFIPFETTSMVIDSITIDHGENQTKSTSEIDEKWFDLQFHDAEKTKIKKPDEIQDRIPLPKIQVDSNILQKVAGSLFGLAVGDALGAHVEFRPREYLSEHPVTDLSEGGTWGLKIGQFTDDTSMALCLANSLIACQGLNLYDQLVRYKWWYRHGYMSSTGECFDIGTATRQSIEEFERCQSKFAQEKNIPVDQIDDKLEPELLKSFNVQCSSDGVAGNGSLMRLAPVPLFFFRDPPTAVEYSGQSGQITHGDQKAYDACRYYGALIVAALQGKSKDELLDDEFYTKHKEWFGKKELHVNILNISRGSYKKQGGYDDGIRGGGYVVKALEAALWAFWSTDSFEKGALAAVNLGEDTDTTAAIYGQLAGAVYKLDELPSKWLEKVYASGFLMKLSVWIVYEGEKWKPQYCPVSTVLCVVPPIQERVTSYDQCLKWSSDDVESWIQSLHPDFMNYADAFKKASIDGSSLLCNVTFENLGQSGIVENVDHRQKIMNDIEQLKRHVSSDFYQQFNDDDNDFVRVARLMVDDQKSKRLDVCQESIDEVERWIKISCGNRKADDLKFIHDNDRYRTFLQQILSIEYNVDHQPDFFSVTKPELGRLPQLMRETRNQRQDKVCIVRGWYGCSREGISDIEKKGFEYMSILGSGADDKGFCFKASARSALKDVGVDGCLIMCYIILRNPCGITIDDPIDLGFPHRYRYYSDHRGQHSILQREYRSTLQHETTVTYSPPSEEINHGFHDEFVTSDCRDILPQVIVYLPLK